MLKKFFMMSLLTTIFVGNAFSANLGGVTENVCERDNRREQRQVCKNDAKCAQTSLCQKFLAEDLMPARNNSLKK